MKKKIMTIAFAAVLAVSLAACGGGTSFADTEEEVEYVSEDEISSVLSNPDEYKGKYIVLTGQVFNKIDTGDSEEQALQAYYDTVNYEDDFVVYCSADENVPNDAYIEVDGKIEGSESFETYLGAQRDVLCIDAVSIAEKSYIDIVVPAVAQIVPEDATVEQNGVSVTVDKVEFADTETRIWITMQNDSSESVDIYPSQGKIVQDGVQYEYNWDSMTMYNSDETEPASSLLPGVSSSGMIVFPAIDSSKEFEYYIEDCYSDDYNIQFEPFVITISAAE